MADADDVFGIEIAHHKPRDIFVLRHVFNICFVLCIETRLRATTFVRRTIWVGTLREICAAVSRRRSPEPREDDENRNEHIPPELPLLRVGVCAFTTAPPVAGLAAPGCRKAMSR